MKIDKLMRDKIIGILKINFGSGKIKLTPEESKALISFLTDCSIAFFTDSRLSEKKRISILLQAKFLSAQSKFDLLTLIKNSKQKLIN